MAQFLIKKDSEVKFENAILKYMQPLHTWNSFRMHKLQFHHAADINHQTKTLSDNFTPARIHITEVQFGLTTRDFGNEYKCISV